MTQRKVFVKFGNGLEISNEEIVLGTYMAGEDDLDLDPERRTNGYLWRNRVLISPAVQFDLIYLPEAKMKAIMDYCRNETFTMTFWYPARGGYYKGEFYCPSNYRQPKLFRQFPTAVYDIHTLKFIGTKGMSKGAI